MFVLISLAMRILLSLGVWRNGSASDSRSEGWEFESLCSHSLGAQGAEMGWEGRGGGIGGVNTGGGGEER